MSVWNKLALALFAKREDTPDTEQVEQTALHELKVSDAVVRNFVEQILNRSPNGIADVDTFGSLITGSRTNTVEVHFDDVNWANYVNTTFTSGGGATQHEGHVHFSSGTNTNGRAKAVSLDAVIYRPMHESYAAWTAAWTNGGVANSYQRIGIADTNFVNGLVIGYEDASFGISWFQNSIKTFVPRASWLDPCQGAATSKFTRDGVPEILDTTLTNIFRMRVGLLGSAPLILEVLSPDGIWVILHRFKRPNLSSEPTFTNFDLPLIVEINKSGAGATNLDVRTACWAGGSTSEATRISDAITDRSLAQTNRSIIWGKTNSGNYVGVAVNSQGRLFVTNDSVGATGSAVPTSASAMGAQQGANLVIPKIGQQTNANSLAVTMSSEQETKFAQIYDKLVELVVAMGAGLPNQLSSTGRLFTQSNVQFENTNVTAANPLPVDVGANIQLGEVTVAFNNTTPDLSALLATPFGANETRETDWFDLIDYAGFKVLVLADQNSAVDGAKVIFTENTTTGDLYTMDGSVYANIPAEFSVARKGRYAKFRYTNGSVAQTVNMRAGIIFTFQPLSHDFAPIAANTDDLTAASRHVSADHVRIVSGGLGVWIPNRGNTLGDKYVTSDSIDSGENEYTPGLSGGTITTSGDSLIYTATAGKAFRIRSITAIPVVRGALEEPPVITVKILNSDNSVYKTPIVGAAISKRKKITGPTDGKIAINLDITARVPWTIDIEEFTP